MFVLVVVDCSILRARKQLGKEDCHICMDILLTPEPRCGREPVEEDPVGSSSEGGASTAAMGMDLTRFRLTVSPSVCRNFSAKRSDAVAL